MSLDRKMWKRIGMLWCAIIMITISLSWEVSAKNEISVSVNAKRAIIMDMETEEVLYGKHIREKCENASTTKLLTAITAVERTSLKKKVRISGNVIRTEPTCYRFRQEDTYYMKELLHATLIMSANDAAVAVAEGSGGSVKNFLKQANAKAKKIGCRNTHFATVNGLHTGETHYTTAYDLAKITKYAYGIPELRSIMKKSDYTVKSVTGRKKKVEATNILLKSRKYYCVGKTGTGSVARYCFAGVYKYRKHPYVLVVLGCSKEEDRWKDVRHMINACRKYQDRVELAQTQ